MTPRLCKIARLQGYLTNPKLSPTMIAGHRASIAVFKAMNDQEFEANQIIDKARFASTLENLVTETMGKAK